MIRLATVGTSAIVRDFLIAANATGHYRHTAAYSRSRERGLSLSGICGVPAVFTDYREMLHSGLADAVYIASPNSCHTEQSREALGAGLHVFCEKPITLSYSDYADTRDLAAEKGLAFAEAIMSRYSPGRAPLKAVLLEAGKPVAARLNFCQRSHRLDELLAGGLPNVFNPAMGGGALNDLGVYTVHAAVDLFGEPEGIAACSDPLPTGADGAGGALLRYPGFTVALTYAKTGQSAAPSEIVYERGAVTIDSISQFTGIKYYTANDCEALFGSLAKTDIMAGEAVAFADYVENPASRKAYEEAADASGTVCRVMDEIRRAASDG